MESLEREAFYLNHFEKQKQSGLGVKAYCKANGLSDCSFYSWRKRLSSNGENHGSKGKRSSSGQRKPEKLSFTSLSVSPPFQAASYVIEFSSGTRFSIHDSLKVQELYQLLHRIKEL